MTTTAASPFEPVAADVNLPALERATLDRWDAERTFEATLEATRSAPRYSFYDGPPFATGLPHYGHLLAGILKDIVPRYWTMRGYHVERRFGWDCHGLPVEQEINKQLNISDRKQVLALGVDTYNEACRGIVKRYTGEWKRTVRRMGRWVDMENAYFTMDPAFMQSVWWVFRQLWDKGLIYEDHKVVPYSVGISTALSNFEAGQDYRDVQDPALTIAFELADEPGTFVLAWTTTPWTLPSNLGLAVHREHEYVKLYDRTTDRRYIVAAALWENLFHHAKPKHDATVLETVKGEALLGMRYKPLFPYFAHKADEGAFKVIHSDHVTLDAGTGVVHIAPAYGEDDFQAGKRNGLGLVNPIDDDGRFTAEVPDLAGMLPKEADATVVTRLKQQGSIFRHDTLTHSYPFCYRSGTPLIYRAVKSWFVRVEQIRERVIAANATTRWVPEHLRDGRFGNWLEGARDWAISRNRFWGTPLPVWRNVEGETVCVGSIEELETLSGQKVTDLHTHFVDKITIPSPTGKSPLKRIEPVLDCWFESGSMPYAQQSYPFANREVFERSFPAEYIAEGLDQTRGWFYTLMVLGAALFDKAPFKNVIVNGLVLAEDGQKMSKSKRNYPDPNEVLERHGADALRLYLIDSPVVRAQELKFSEKGVRDIVRRILLRWWNAYSFFVSYASLDGFTPRGDARKSENVLDRWVLSRLNTLIATTNREMEGYRLYNVVPALLAFIEGLTNTYIRFNRRHFWAEGMPEDKRLAFETLHEVLLTTAKVMAPFTPFMSEVTYANLSRGSATAKASVHLEAFPSADETLRDAALEGAVARMEQAVLQGRNLREQIGVKGRCPLRTLTVIHHDAAVLDAMRPLAAYIADELNVQSVVFTADERAWMTLSAKANFKRLGARLGKKMKEVAGLAEKLTADQILTLESGEALTLAGESITLDDVEIRRTPRAADVPLQASASIAVALDPTVTPELREEGLAREVRRRIQMARKLARARLDQQVAVEISVSGELLDAAKARAAWLASETLSTIAFVESPAGDHVETFDVDGDALVIGVKLA
ncbi:MAG: isoleucine--tRNA ligase [Polyangiales bacterium]